MYFVKFQHQFVFQSVKQSADAHIIYGRQDDCHSQHQRSEAISVEDQYDICESDGKFGIDDTGTDEAATCKGWKKSAGQMVIE